jgi:hypothetical protein
MADARRKRVVSRLTVPQLWREYTGQDFGPRIDDAELLRTSATLTSEHEQTSIYNFETKETVHPKEAGQTGAHAVSASHLGAGNCRHH